VDAFCIVSSDSDYTRLGNPPARKRPLRDGRWREEDARCFRARPATGSSTWRTWMYKSPLWRRAHPPLPSRTGAKRPPLPPKPRVPRLSEQHFADEQVAQGIRHRERVKKRKPH
jgi:hypothetical protein